MKKLFISLIYVLTSILILTFILTIFNYFNIISNTSIFKILIPITSILIGSIYIGIKSNKKGFIEGIKLGSIYIISTVIINILFISNFKVRNILYYLIILIASILGSMIGINIKKSN